MSKKKGDQWELIAINYLQSHNYQIKDVNFKFWRFGEVDIIASKNGYTIFIEVKYRSSDVFWIPEESISKTKLHKCRKTVEYYCKKYRVDFETIRFDVITIIKWARSYKLTHYKDIEI